MKQLQNMTKTTAPTEKVVLLNGQSVDKAFYQEIFLQAKTVVPEMQANKLYTVRELFGEDYWQIMTNYLKRMAGRCFAKMVHDKVFDLQFIQFKRSPTKRYILIVD